MPYKISGTLSDAARIIVVKESDWSVESNTTKSAGSYEATGLVSGAKLVVGRKSDGETSSYGNITATAYGDRGVIGAGWDDVNTFNTVSYITISTTGDATDFGDLTDDRRGLSATSNGQTDRGVFAGGVDAVTYFNILDYITIDSTGNATDFGDITQKRFGMGAVSNGTSDRGVFGGGYDNTAAGTYYNIIDYITISTTGNATDFGDTTNEVCAGGGSSNGTNDRGVFAGGQLNGPITVNVMDYITISSTGNAIDFGDLTVARRWVVGTSNATDGRGVFAGGTTGASVNTIDYITISSTGNATDFGDLTILKKHPSATSNGTNDRGVFGGGHDDINPSNIIDYITISSASNASDFGDLAVATTYSAATSNA